MSYNKINTFKDKVQMQHPNISLKHFCFCIFTSEANKTPLFQGITISVLESSKPIYTIVLGLRNPDISR